MSNIATWAVKIVPADLPFSRRAEVAQRLGTLLKMDPSVILDDARHGPGFAASTPCASRRTCPRRSRASFPSPWTTSPASTSTSRRDANTRTAHCSRTSSATPGPSTAAQLARLKEKGYLADDLIGKTGVESTFESELRGTYGRSGRAGCGRPRRQVLRTTQQAVPGASLTLTIDATIQRRPRRRSSGACARPA